MGVEGEGVIIRGSVEGRSGLDMMTEGVVGWAVITVAAVVVEGEEERGGDVEEVADG